MVQNKVSLLQISAEHTKMSYLMNISLTNVYCLIMFINHSSISKFNSILELFLLLLEFQKYSFLILISIKIHSCSWLAFFYFLYSIFKIFMKLNDRTKSRQTTVWNSFGNVIKLNSVPMYYRGHWLSIHPKVLGLDLYSDNINLLSTATVQRLLASTWFHRSSELYVSF